ncbi:MAG TPA: hypothetical protein VHT70_05735 [Candidatus Saccharimonadales bacterium]|jgi:hypothetical protein|nr:hypothetical protein [Candidatus Saccharimonadales bacterium]
MEIPPIQELRNRYDIPGPIFGPRDITDGIAITSGPDGYKITAYPEMEYGYEGFTVTAQAPEGIFGDELPTRVETGNDKNTGVIAIEAVEEPEVGADGLTTQSMRIGPTPPAREGLILPGDEGYDIIEQLHRGVSALAEPIAETVGTLGVVIEPHTLQFNEPVKNTGVRSFEPDEVTLARRTVMEVRDRNGNYAKVDLDGSISEPLLPTGHWPNFGRDPLMVYRAGEAEISIDGEVERRPLDMDSLVAFAGLYATMRPLYREQL